MKHMYLRGTFKQNRSSSNTFHPRCAIWGAVRQAAWETFSLFVDRYGIPFSCGYTLRRRLLLLTDGRKTGRILQIREDTENKWGEDSQERQGGDKGRRGAKVPLKDGGMSDNEEHRRDNAGVWIVSFLSTFASQRERVGNPAEEKVTSVEKRKLFNGIPDSWKTHFSSFFLFYLCNSRHIMQLYVILNSQPRP